MRTSLKVTFAALSLIAAGTLVACSSGSKDSSDKAISVVIATDGATKPFTYSDSQGNLTATILRLLVRFSRNCHSIK